MSRGIIRDHVHGLSWYHEGVSEEGNHEIAPLDYDRAAQVGQMLWDANIKGVLCRYPGDTRETMPGPVGENFIYYHQRRSWPVPINPVAVLKALNS